MKTFRLVGDVTTEMADSFIAWTKTLKPKTVAQLRINSPGGCATSGLRMLDAIRDSDAIIIAKTHRAGSVAAALAAACPICELDASGELMFHRIQGKGFNATEASLRVEARKMDLQFVDALVDKTGQPRDVIFALFGDGDVRLTAEQALDLGLVDVVGSVPNYQSKNQSSSMPKNGASKMSFQSNDHRVIRNRVCVCTGSLAECKLHVLQHGGTLDCWDGDQWNSVLTVSERDAQPPDISLDAVEPGSMFSPSDKRALGMD